MVDGFNYIEIRDFGTHQRIEVGLHCPTAKHIGSTAPQFSGTRPTQDETEAFPNDEPLHLVQKNGQRLNLIDDDQSAAFAHFQILPQQGRIALQAFIGVAFKQVVEAGIGKQLQQQGGFPRLSRAKQESAVLTKGFRL